MAVLPQPFPQGECPQVRFRHPHLLGELPPVGATTALRRTLEQL